MVHFWKIFSKLQIRHNMVKSSMTWLWNMNGAIQNHSPDRKRNNSETQIFYWNKKLISLVPGIEPETQLSFFPAILSFLHALQFGHTKRRHLYKIWAKHKLFIMDKTNFNHWSWITSEKSKRNLQTLFTAVATINISPKLLS